MSGQGLPKGEGYWRTCRVRVSWPRLNPQVLPDREQGLHLPHSPTSQCTKLRATTTTKTFIASVMCDFCGFLNDFLLRLTLKCALHEFVTGLVVLWADVVTSPTQQVQALSAPRARITVGAGLAICWAFCKDNHAQVYLSLGKPNSPQTNHWDSYWERIPSVLRCGLAPPGRSPGICPGEGRILLGIVCRSSWRSRSHTLTCTLDKEPQTHRQRLFKPYVIKCVLPVKYTPCHSVACCTGNTVKGSDWCLVHLHTWFHLAPLWRNTQYERGISFFTCLSTGCVDPKVLQCHVLKKFFSSSEQANGAYICHVPEKYMVKRTGDKFKTLNQRTVTQIGLILTAVHLHMQCKDIFHTHTLQTNNLLVHGLLSGKRVP